MPIRPRLGWLLGTLLIGGSLLAATIYITSRKDMTNLDNGLLQFIFFSVGIAVAYIFGRWSIASAAAEVVKPHGRKAVRRIVNLAQALQSFGIVLSDLRVLASATADRNQGLVPIDEVDRVLDVLDNNLATQLRTVADAIEDWRDIVPEEVEAIEQRAREVEQRERES
jgi:hypothetical protein